MAGAGGAHHVERGKGSVEGADRVHLEHRPLLARVLVIGEAGEEDPCVVDPDVERPRAFGDLAGGGLARFGVRDVELQGPGARADRLGGARGGFAVDVADRDRVATAGEHASDREPEPPT
jgi:hypothetical protein